MRRSFAVFGFAVVTAGRPALAQGSFPNVRLVGRLQEQFYAFGNGDYAGAVGPESNFFLRRARIEARGEITERVTIYLQPSFEGGRSISASTSCQPVVVNGPLPDTVAVNCATSGSGGFRLRDAWIELRLNHPEARTAVFLRAGQEKRPFGRYELTSSNNLPSIERGAGRGLVAGAPNDLFVAQQFMAHDVGAHARLEHRLDDHRRLTVTAGVYNGRGESLNDNNNAKSFGFRATAGVWRRLDLGAAFYSADAVVAGDSGFRHHAWEVDGQWGRPGDEGLYVVADYTQGQDATAARHTMRGFTAVAAYHIRIKHPRSWLYAVEPALRFDYADPDTRAADNGATLFTAVAGVYLSSRAQFRVAYERQDFQSSGAPSISGMRTALTVNF
ncbi:MAG TPA: porin [Gemmatimonadales bacterium]|nr:porin [Gemmatimonadales bacterium]